MKFITAFLLLVEAECYRLSQSQNLDLRKTCGVRKLGKFAPFKIYGGRKVDPGEFPWFAKILTLKDLGDISYNDTCGGSLISPRHVITAAHCVTNFDPDKVLMECSGELDDYVPSAIHPNVFKVYVGTLCNHPEKCQHLHRVKKIIVHKKWKRCLQSRLYNESQTQKHDFAILELQKTVYENEATPICLPNRKLPLAKLLRGAGAGKDSEADDPGLKVARLSLYGEEPEHMVIVTSSTNASACGGDSGGPLFQFNRRKRYTLVGVLSGGYGSPGCREPFVVNFYGDVRRHLKWICKHTGVCPTEE